MDNNYVCYHLHDENSLLDSCTNYKLYVDKAEELGQKAICFTNHGNIYNWIEKKMYVNSKGMKYLHGCEVYLTEQLFFYPEITDKWYEENNDKSQEELIKLREEKLEKEKYKIRDNYHTILIAKNYEGFKELNELIDLSTRPDHFYYKPRITFDEFFNISDNVIKISACLASPLSHYPSNDNANPSIYEKLLTSYDFYEVQPHVNSLDQVRYNKMLSIASKTYNIPLIAGTDTHSLDKYKAECRKVLKAAKKMDYDNEDEFDLTYKSYNELYDMFKKQGALSEDEILLALDNTNILADMVDDFELDTSFKYPKCISGGDDEKTALWNRIVDKYNYKVNNGIINADDRYISMAKEEMRVFEKIGMIGFMLFMSELICWCWDNSIPIGFCRGSVGGSVVAYLTDIIDVDPLIWNTMFSRFANEDRVEVGDIDIDVSPSQRHLVYEHIIETYGEDSTAYVLAMDTISDKGTIDEIARALSYEEEYKEKYSLNNAKIIKALFDEDPEKAKKDYPELFYYFDGLNGTVISQSMHPAGIIVSPITLPDNYGTFWNDGKRILSINMEEIHEVSLIKYDILGLKNIEIIKDCCEYANIPYPKSHLMNWEDKEVWEHITDSPVGIFQMNSKFAFESMKKMNCKCIDDLSLVNASIRPSGESYRDRLLNGEWNKNPSELIDKELSASRGFLAYQEQVISFLQNVCGLSGSDADNVRRAIGRKQMDRLQAALPQILDGYCSKSDKPREEAEEEAKTFLKIIEDSSNYMFGRNHSTGYSMIGYVCAYLRYYYPVEFITAFLNNSDTEQDTNDGVALMKEMGITLEGIKFRHSKAKYSCNSDIKTIFKGIESIKFLNTQIADELFELGNNKYDSFIDLLIDIKNISVDSRQLDILIKLNFFEEFGDINYLLKCVEVFNMYYGKKQLDKTKIDNDTIEIGRKYMDKETTRKIVFSDTTEFIKEITSEIVVQKTSIGQIIRYQQEHLGYIDYKDESLDPKYVVVTELNTKYSPKFKAYCLKSGKVCELKVSNKRPYRSKEDVTLFSEYPFINGDILYMKKCEKKQRVRKTEDGFEPVDGEFDWWVKQYNIATL